jgi:hypothetical protein
MPYLYWTKKIFYVLMLSSSGLKLCRVCRVEGWNLGIQSLVGNGAVESQHGTGVEGSSHPWAKDQNKDFF